MVRSSESNQVVTMPIFISFYTRDTPYEQEAERLRTSLNTLNLNYEIRGLKSLGSWVRNCGQKAKFIQGMLEELQQPVVWVDADATVVKRPVLFESFEEEKIEFAAHRKHMVTGGKELLSGTLYFKPCSKVNLLLEDWVRNCVRFSDLWDQRLLDHAIRGLPTQHVPKTQWLPQGYCKIFDRIWREQPKVAYIVHHQASRRLRRKIR